MTSAWDRITDAGPAAIVVVVATAALLVLPVLRRLAPRHRRRGGGAARFFLGAALVLAAMAMGLGTMGAASPGNVLQLVALLVAMAGLVGVAGVVIFDVVLPRLRIDVPSIVRDLLLVAVVVAIGMGCLRLAGLDLFPLVTTSAVLTAVVGLALQSTLANVLGGLALEMDRTLRHGEWIEVGGRVGRIVEIGWRSTRVQTKDGDTIFVPNAELVTQEVRNLGKTIGSHRTTLQVAFSDRHPPDVVRRVLLAAVGSVPGVLTRPAPEGGATEFGDGAVVYAVRYWIGDFGQETTVAEDARARIWHAARRAGLEFPSATRVVVFGDEGRPEFSIDARTGLPATMPVA